MLRAMPNRQSRARAHAPRADRPHGTSAAAMPGPSWDRGQECAEMVHFGRDPELKDLAEVIDGVDEPGGCLIIQGEPGIGKSALVGRVGAAAAVAGMSVFTTTGVESEQNESAVRGVAPAGSGRVSTTPTPVTGSPPTSSASRSLPRKGAHEPGAASGSICLTGRSARTCTGSFPNSASVPVPISPF
jgi:hypothetical protein